MQPYWEAFNNGGTLLRMNMNGGPGERDNATEAIIKSLNLEFETVEGFEGDACPDEAFNEELVERINNAAGVWFGGGLPGRAVSCLFGRSAQAFGINTPPDETTPVLKALLACPIIGGISAGAMMQPSAPLLHGNEISYTPGFHQSAEIMRVGELMMNNRGSVSDLLYFDSSFLHFCPNVLHFCSNLRHFTQCFLHLSGLRRGPVHNSQPFLRARVPRHASHWYCKFQYKCAFFILKITLFKGFSYILSESSEKVGIYIAICSRPTLAPPPLLDSS